jgi:hypothetical protein
VLGKRKFKSTMMSDELAYNMQLFYEGYEPKHLLKAAGEKLEFERERMHA